MTKRWMLCVPFIVSVFTSVAARGAERITVDLSKYDSKSEVRLEVQGDLLSARWPIDEKHAGLLQIDLRSDKPLIRAVAIAVGDESPRAILKEVDPAMVITVGTRDLSREGWVTFFDKVNTRPYESFPMKIARKSARVVSDGARVTLVTDGATAGPFAGDFRFTLIPGSALIHAKAVMQTDRAATAFLFDSGLVSRTLIKSWKHVVYKNNDQHDVVVPSDAMQSPAVRVAVRSRLIGAEGADGGCVYLMPHPHQYFYPLDFCDNYSTAWVGANYREHVDGSGFGVCQPIDGDRRYVPWVNSPPGSMQHMGVFYLLDPGTPESAFKSALAYTHGDRFESVEGYKTFTSHYHVEMTIERLREIERIKRQGGPDRHARPEFVEVMRNMGIDIAHLAEFHLGDGDLKIAPRIDRLKLLHDECEKWSDASFLLLPGEEPNVHLGGHWISLFPKPIYWTLDRAKDQHFVEDDAELGKVYHVGSADDVLKLMEAENGLMWTAHPRIKGSIGFPDLYKSTAFFQTPHFLGAAWKAMPADYSIPRLGTRVLDLLDDMANWGTKKRILGEVDVFAIDRHSELYAHANVNYLKLNALPRFRDGWQSILDALRAGRFFTTSGEVLITAFSINGKGSGDDLLLTSDVEASMLRASLRWTFPLDYAEVITGDGTAVQRQRINLSDTKDFGERELSVKVDLRNKKWARLEVWDIARNGAFTQPIHVGQ